MVEQGTRWDLLRDLRKTGKKPAFPVFLTDSNTFLRNLDDVGAFAIFHSSGMRLPAELLEGLDVRLHFIDCNMGGRVVQMLRGKAIEPKTLETWCRCANGYTVSCGPCDDGSEPWAQ